MGRYVYPAAVVLLSAASAWLLWWSDLPLGVPGEWTWERIDPGDDPWTPGLLAGPAVALAVAALYAAACWAVGRRLGRDRPIVVAVWLGLLAVAGGALVMVVASAPPAGHDLARMPVVLYDPGASGYFTIARYGEEGEPIDVPRFLAGYEQRMRGGDVLHIGTHPPGLMLLERGVIELCRRSPSITAAVRAVTPDHVDEAFDMLDRQARIGPPLDDTDRAALWLAVLSMHALAAAAVIPLYLLVRRYHTRTASWRAASLWPLIPAITVFLPKSDLLFPLLGTLFLWLWLEGCGRGSVLRSALAGAVLWLGLFLSLAMLPVVALGGFLAVWEWRTAPVVGARHSVLRRLLVAMVSAAVGLAVPIVVLWLACDLNLLNVWLWNYRNHAGFYDEYPRTWWKWLCVNPVEFALAAGAPLAVAAGCGAWLCLRSGTRRTDPIRPVPVRPSALRLFQAGPVIGCLVTWSIVWLWGKNMGEAARLWLVFQPWLVWIAAGSFADPGTAAGSPRDDGQVRWMWTIAVQTIVCVATVMRVSGFHYLDSEPAGRPAAAGQLPDGVP